MRARYLLFLLIPFVLLAILLVTRPHRHGIERGVVLSPKQVKILKMWASHDYIPIEHTGEFQRAMSLIRIKDEAGRPNKDAAQALSGAIKDFLCAYHDGTYEAFSRFVLPVTNIAPNPEQQRGRVEIVQKLWKQLKIHSVPPISENDAASVLRAFWKLCNGPHDRSALGADADYYRTDFLEAIAVGQSEIRVFEGTALPAIASYASEQESIGFFRDSHSIVFEPSVASLVSRDGTVRFALARLQLKTKSDPPMPVLILYYWVPDHGKWLPLELGIPYSPRRRHGFLM